MTSSHQEVASKIALKGHDRSRVGLSTVGRHEAREVNGQDQKAYLTGQWGVIEGLKQKHDRITFAMKM